MRSFFLFCFLAFTLFADINMSIVKESNTTFYLQLAKELNQSLPDYKLQNTLLQKIISLSKHKDSTLLSKKDFAIKNAQTFINTFYKINKLLAQSLQKKEEIEKLDAQLADIKEAADSNSTLTNTLEYTFYYKKRLADERFAQKVLKEYPKWLDKLLELLPRIDFPTKNVQKSVAQATKSLLAIDKRIKKYTIEYERYKILGSMTRARRALQDIDYLKKKKEHYVQTIVKAKLLLFFNSLKRSEQSAFSIAGDIITFLQKHSTTPHLAQAFETTLFFMLNKKIGSFKATLINLKNEILAFLNNNSVIGIPLYKFAEALGIFLLFLLFRRLFALIILRSLHHLAGLTKTSVDDKIIEILEGPLKFSFVILGLYFALTITGIESDTFDKILKSLIIFVIFWLFYNAVNILDETIYRFARKFGRELYREIGAFFIKTLKIFIFAIGLVSILQEWNINVSAFIASLGLGGLAFALAAKDTAANLFGGLSILADRALKIDDWIKVGNVEGTVEDIGLRTIKVRTFEKSLVTVPNQIIANNPIENFSRRNIRRIKMRIGLVYSTTHEQMQKILNEIRNMLQSHPGIAKNATLLVNFDEFEDSSLSIFIYCFTNTANWAKYLAIREDINLKIMEIVQRHGSDFAFPSESIYIEKLPKDEKDSDNR